MLSGRKPGNQNTVNENIYTGSEIAARGKRTEIKSVKNLACWDHFETNTSVHKNTQTHKTCFAKLVIRHITKNSSAMILKIEHILNTLLKTPK